MCVCEREEREKDKEIDRDSLCVWEREKEGEKGKEREREREWSPIQVNFEKTLKNIWERARGRPRRWSWHHERIWKWSPA